jgi:hypothetical protein
MRRPGALCTKKRRNPVTDQPPQPGETWAYRAQARTLACPTVPVEILAVGTGRNRGLRIRFLAGDEVGEEHWVPAARLLVPWADREAWLRDEAARAAARAASCVSMRDPAYQAASLVLAASPRPGGVRLGVGHREGAVLVVPDLPGLARALGWDADRLRREPLAFVDPRGSYVAPWAVARGVAHALAELYAERVLERVAEEEAVLRQEAHLGRTTALRDGSTHTVPPEACAVTLRLRERVFAIVRGWCGAAEVVRFDRTARLEAEVARLRGLLAAGEPPSATGERGEDRSPPLR